MPTRIEPVLTPHSCNQVPRRLYHGTFGVSWFLQVYNRIIRRIVSDMGVERLDLGWISLLIDTIHELLGSLSWSGQLAIWIIYDLINHALEKVRAAEEGAGVLG